MPPILTRHLRDLLIRQDNVVALWQLPPPQRRAAIRAARCGQWRRLSHHAFLWAPGAASSQQLAWAALLHCGEHALLSGRTALVLHGWEQELQQPHDVVVPQRVQPLPGPNWLRIHRLSGPLDGPQALPSRTSPHLATVHAAAWARSDREAMFIVVSALQQRLTSPARLMQALQPLPRLRRRGLIADVVREYANGAQSLNELDFAALCRRFSVPEPFRQTRVYDIRGKLRAIDARFRTASGRVFVHVQLPAHPTLEQTRRILDPAGRNISLPASSSGRSVWVQKSEAHLAAPWCARVRDLPLAYHKVVELVDCLRNVIAHGSRSSLDAVNAVLAASTAGEESVFGAKPMASNGAVSRYLHTAVLGHARVEQVHKRLAQISDRMRV